MDTAEAGQQLYQLFGQPLGLQLPGNTGPGRNVAKVCEALFNEDLYAQFCEWDAVQAPPGHGLPANPLGMSRLLLQRSMWEGAWALGQLHYAQWLQREAQTNDRENKGHPCCGLAILGRDMGCNALERHFAMLSSIGDVYFEARMQELSDGGFGRTMIERFEASEVHDIWRERWRQLVQSITGPAHLEALLASRWLPNREQTILGLATVATGPALPFENVLLDASDNTGAALEAATALVLSSTPGFEIFCSRREGDSQTDLVYWYEDDGLADLHLPPGPGLVECKTGKVDARIVREFAAKCMLLGTKSGIIVTSAGHTGANSSRDEGAELARRRFQLDGLIVLILDAHALRGRSRKLRGVLPELVVDHRRLAFGFEAAVSGL